VTARVHPVHLTNVGQRQAAADLKPKPADLDDDDDDDDGCGDGCGVM